MKYFKFNLKHFDDTDIIEGTNGSDNISGAGDYSLIGGENSLAGGEGFDKI